MISLNGLIHSVILLIVAGLIFGLLFWLLDYCKPREPFYMVGRVVLAIAVVLVAIGILLSLAGFTVFVP